MHAKPRMHIYHFSYNAPHEQIHVHDINPESLDRSLVLYLSISVRQACAAKGQSHEIVVEHVLVTRPVYLPESIVNVS